MERRRFRRPRLRLNVRASIDRKPVGHVLNLTDEGLCLTGRGAPPLDSQSLLLQLPLSLSGHRELTVLAEPRWHDYLPNGHWRGGFKLQVDESTAAALTTLASRYGDN